jgi:hypothetical protein
VPILEDKKLKIFILAPYYEYFAQYNLKMTQVKNPYGEEYPYVLRPDSRYLEISLDPESTVFHPSQVMGSICGYTFTPYSSAGLADVVSYLQTGIRETHLSEDYKIGGFTFNVAFPLQYGLSDDLAKFFPELQSFGKDLINKLESKEITQEQALGMTEAKFGKEMRLSKESIADIRRIEPAEVIERLAKARAEAGLSAPIVLQT